jgi:hypothetical protein
MRSWILIGVLLAACSTTTKPDVPPTPVAQPTVTGAPTTQTVQPTPDAGSATPNITYQYHPRTQLLERVTDTAVQPVSQDILVQQAVANHDHTKLAIRTLDDTTMLRDVATNLAIGPFDACDSMTWAPDTTTLWCMRFGHVYAIDTNDQTDLLTLAATDGVYWAELTRHPVTQDYWMVVVGDDESKLCQFSVDTRTVENACLTTGQQPRWSPDGQLLASIDDQRLIITQVDGTQIASVGLGDMQVTQLVWHDTTHVVINTPTQSYRYQINDARISLQASDVVIVGR